MHMIRKGQMQVKKEAHPSAAEQFYSLSRPVIVIATEPGPQPATRYAAPQAIAPCPQIRDMRSLFPYTGRRRKPHAHCNIRFPRLADQGAIVARCRTATNRPRESLRWNRRIALARLTDRARFGMH